MGTMWSKPGYCLASKVMSYMITTHPNLCFSSDIIEIIHPGPYDSKVDDDGIIIEKPDNQRVIDENETKEQKQKKTTINDLEQSIITAPQWEDQVKEVNNDEIIPNSVEHELMVKENQNRRFLLHWHHRLGHLFMKMIQRLASMGLLPSMLAKCKIPVCQACAYGMMTRKAWRSKRDIRNIEPDALAFTYQWIN
jgi:GAG-pre-integrase domain